MGESNIRIVTVNIPQSYLKAIATLVGDQGLYPSRSELIRVAVRNFLIWKLNAAKSFEQYQQKQKEPEPEMQDHFYIRVPVGETIEGLTVYKTYKKVFK